MFMNSSVVGTARALSEAGNSAEMDLTKGTRKETQAPQGEEIITGVTHNSILKFVESRNNVPIVPAKTGLIARIKGLFNR